MKSLVILVVLLTNSTFANAEICGRFSEPIQSILEHTVTIQFDFTKISTTPSHCFHYEPRGIRCDITYIGQRYFFFFNERFSKGDVDSGIVEASFIQWLRSESGKEALIKTYNTVFAWDNDYEDESCDTSYEQQTSTLTIDQKESVILE